MPICQERHQFMLVQMGCNAISLQTNPEQHENENERYTNIHEVYYICVVLVYWWASLNLQAAFISMRLCLPLAASGFWQHHTKYCMNQ